MKKQLLLGLVLMSGMAGLQGCATEDPLCDDGLKPEVLPEGELKEMEDGFDKEGFLTIEGGWGGISPTAKADIQKKNSWQTVKKNNPNDTDAQLYSKWLKTDQK
jgi:hypothetical protein